VWAIPAWPKLGDTRREGATSAWRRNYIHTPECSATGLPLCHGHFELEAAPHRDRVLLPVKIVLSELPHYNVMVVSGGV